eukprot:6258104-Pyramimonas_sp.AAC.1
MPCRWGLRRWARLGRLQCSPRPEGGEQGAPRAPPAAAATPPGAWKPPRRGRRSRAPRTWPPALP